MLFRLIWTLFVGLVVPAVGYWLAQNGLAQRTGSFPDYFSFFSIAESSCYSSGDTIFGGECPFCVAAARLAWLRNICAFTFIMTFVLLIGYTGAAVFAGANRALNAAIFPILMPLSVWTVVLLIVLQGVILTSIVAIIALPLAPLLYWTLLVIIGSGALIGAASMISVLRGATTAKPVGVLGRAVVRGEAPMLWGFVDEMSDLVGARQPKTIIVGLEPTFFATAAPVVTPESRGSIRGETLYLSLPLMRLLKESELRAVVGHELGHFHGEDTAYSMRFAPVYHRLQAAIVGLDGADRKPNSVATLPGSTILNFMLSMFSRNERRISREREFEADQVGASVSSPRDVAVSLSKVAVFAPLWGKVRADNVARLSEGKIARNLSRIYADAALYDVNHHALGDYMTKLLRTRLTHPTDSHPPIADRFEALPFQPTSLTIDDLTSQSGPTPLFDELVSQEEAMTLIEHKLMIATGAARTPEKESDDVLLNAAYILAATMVQADDEVLAVEVKTAEMIGSELFIGFDPVSFREVFDQLDGLPRFSAVAELLADTLSPDQLKQVHDFLSAIANADGEMHPRERALLDAAASRWAINKRMGGLRRRLRRTGGGTS